MRVTAPAFDMVPRDGRLIDATADSLTIAFDGDRSPATIGITQITRLDVATGRNLERGVSRGIEIGLVTGVLLGAGLGVLAYAEEICPLGCVVVASFAGSISGLAVGALVGAATAPTRWEEVPLRGGGGRSGMLRGQATMRLGLTVSF